MNDFNSKFVTLYDNGTTLPFTAGGVTQDGENKGRGARNNQDAACLLINNGMIIAVVCDGCGGASPYGLNRYSFNETGAQLLAAISLEETRKLIEAGANADTIVERLEISLTDKLEKLLELLGGGRERYLLEMLCATILVGVVTNDYWCLLHCGDGLIGYNGSVQDLGDYSGVYLANKLMDKNSQSLFHVAASGDTKDLLNILVASDGVLDLTGEGGSLVTMLNTPDNRAYPYGYDGKMGFTREFRRRVGRKTAARGDSHDDRTLIMIRRVNHASIERGIDCGHQ